MTTIINKEETANNNNDKLIDLCANTDLELKIVFLTPHIPGKSCSITVIKLTNGGTNIRKILGYIKKQCGSYRYFL